MRKMRLFLCGLFAFCLMFIAGCNKDKDVADTFADVSNSDDVYDTSTKNPLTVGDVYSQMRKDLDSVIAKNIMIDFMKKQLAIENNSNVLYKDLYKKYVNEKFNQLFVDSNSYNFNNEFSEEKVVNYLKSENYSIVCEGSYTSVLDAPFTCDYSDYIEKELDYDIYVKLLKIKYILEEKESMIDKYKVRNINYYSINVSSGEVDTIRAEMEKYVSDLLADSSIEDIAADKRKQKLDKIEEEYKKISTSDDSNFTYLEKFTTCGNVRCSVEKGKEYLENQVETYYTSKVVTKNDTDILYESARDILFSDSIEDYLYEVGDDVNGYKYYLVSPVYANDSEYVSNDIILFNNVSSALAYYIVEVKVIDSSSEDTEKALAAEVLVEKVNNNTVFSHYFEESDLEIHDKAIREIFISTYGDYKGE